MLRAPAVRVGRQLLHDAADEIDVGVSVGGAVLLFGGAVFERETACGVIGGAVGASEVDDLDGVADA